MKVALTIKNTSRVLNPKNNDVIVFDGENWYVTTKEALLEDAYKLIEEAKAEIETLKAENDSFKKGIASQMVELSKVIETMYGGTK